MKKITILFSFVLSLLLSQSLLAHEKESCYEKSSRIEKVTEKLNLSTEQHAKIKAIRSETKQKLKPIYESLRSLRNEINDAFKTNKLSEMKQNAFVHKEKNLIGSILKIKMHARAEIGKILTDVQREKAIKMVNQWKEQHKKKQH